MKKIKFRKDSKVGAHAKEIKRLYASGKSTGEIGSKFNIDPSNIYHALKRMGVQLRTQKESTLLAAKQGKMSRKGKDCWNWQGWRLHTSGYILILMPCHYRANSTGYVPLSNLVAEEYYGRKLEPNEIVHHIDGNKKNDDPRNLLIITRSGHGKLHANANDNHIGINLKKG